MNGTTIENLGMMNDEATEADVQWYAISVHQLYGASGQYQFLQDQQPIDKAGYSIWIFRVPSAPTEN